MRISELTENLLLQPLPADEIRARERDIEQHILANSKLLRGVNFQELCSDDLRLIYQLYDESFFRSAISAELFRTKSELNFRLSNRLTSAAAKTTVFKHLRKSRYEIAFSTTLLAGSFVAAGQAHWVAGRLCESRLQALQRLMEHELIHLVELLSFGNSSCGAKRFKTLSANLFQHECSHHRLLRPGERMRAELGLGVGDRVSFTYAGRQYFGRINRVTKRATILVPDGRGRPYADGGRYRKFHVPIERLIAADNASLIRGSIPRVD